jgi:AraC family transcriptional regulator
MIPREQSVGQTVPFCLADLIGSRGVIGYAPRTMKASSHLPARPSGHHTMTVGDDSIELLPRMPYEASYTPEAGVVGFAFETQTGTHAFASDRKTAFRARPNSLAYLPVGCGVFSRSDNGGEYLTLKVARFEGSTDRRFNDHIDPEAIIAAQGLRRGMLARRPEPLELEYHVLTLRSVVASVFARQVSNAQAGRWMTIQRLKRVDEFIDAHLDGKLSIREIAAHLGLSTGFFNRAFKGAVGKTPHDYIIDRRISRARVLLRTRQLGLAEVAAATGFASHAHMTFQFRSRLGTTPSFLRTA